MEDVCTKRARNPLVQDLTQISNWLLCPKKLDLLPRPLRRTNDTTDHGIDTWGLAVGSLLV